MTAERNGRIGSRSCSCCGDVLVLGATAEENLVPPCQGHGGNPVCFVKQTGFWGGVKRDWRRYGLPSVRPVRVLHAEPSKETSHQETRSVSSSSSKCAFLSCARQLPLLFNHPGQIGRESPALLLMLEDSEDTWESFPECGRLAGSNSCAFVPSGSVVSHNSLILSPRPHHLLSHRSRGL